MRSGTRRLVAGGALIVLLGCQNWDMLEPEERSPAATRSFTPIGDEEPGPLTGDLAMRRLEAIVNAEGQARLDLVDAFLEEYREARLIPQVHRAAAEAHLAAGRPGAAADAFERALVVTRTDLLGLPLDTDLPLQLAMSALATGDSERGLPWLARTTIADESQRVVTGLRWAHAELAPDRDFDDWVRSIREPILPQAPPFDLPGFQAPRVAAPDARAKATVINFWSPT